MPDDPEILNLTVLMPVFNDWTAVTTLLKAIGQTKKSSATNLTILLVDDGSTEACPPALHEPWPAGIGRIHMLRLRRNLGHQRAIAIGLTWLHEHMPCEGVVVMDADGEDAPVDMFRLLHHFRETGRQYIVFAQRLKRSEGLVFLVFYHLYRLLHFLLTGIPVRIGNFSILPFTSLANLIAASELWNHYAAAVIKSRLPIKLVPAPRAARLAGRSRMNFVALVTHGMSAISVFSETVGVRLLVGSLAALVFTLVLLAAVIIVRLSTHMTIPGWATYTVSSLSIVLMVLVIGIALITIFMLSARNNTTFIPIRDYTYFVKDVEVLYAPDARIAI